MPAIVGTESRVAMNFTDGSQAQDCTGPYTYILQIPIQDNDDPNFDDYVEVELAPDYKGTDYAVAEAANSARVAIIDDDSVELSIANASGTEGTGSGPDDNGSVAFTITATNPFAESFTLAYEVAAGTANSADAADFLNEPALPFTGTVVFAASYGEESNATRLTETITIPVMADAVKEPDETFAVTLTGLPNNPDSSFVKIDSEFASAVGTIDNDDGVEVSIVDSAVGTEGTGAVPANNGSVDFTVSATDNQADAFAVAYTVRSVTTDVDDFHNQSTPTFTGVVSFNAPEGGMTGLTETLSIPISADTEKESDETFTIELGTVSGAGASTVTVSTSANRATGTTVNLCERHTLPIGTVRLPISFLQRTANLPLKSCRHLILGTANHPIIHECW